MMPAARKEIAIGMKITTLNAVDHLIRSASTAKIRPRAQAMVGAVISQITLFFSAVRVAGSVKMSL
jgi:hypothetical protein